MNNNFKFPIKYAVLKLSIGFIVSKCYIIEDTTRYYEDGSSNKQYNVVFPYPSIEEYMDNIYYDYDTKDIGARNTPKHDFWGNVYNTQTVEKVFDSYLEASLYASIKNKELSSNILQLHSKYQQEVEDINLKFSLDMKVCEKFEKLIFEKTTDMEVLKEEKSSLELEESETQKNNNRVLVNKINK